MRKRCAERLVLRVRGLVANGQRWRCCTWLHVALLRLTLRFASSLVNTGADDHDIVDNGETALAANPLSTLAEYITVGQYGCLVHDHLPLMELLGIWQLIFVEEVPGGPIDDLIWCVAENVDDRVGRVENVRLG